MDHRVKRGWLVEPKVRAAIGIAAAMVACGSWAWLRTGLLAGGIASVVYSPLLWCVLFVAVLGATIGRGRWASSVLTALAAATVITFVAESGVRSYAHRSARLVLEDAIERFARGSPVADEIRELHLHGVSREVLGEDLKRPHRIEFEDDLFGCHEFIVSFGERRYYFDVCGTSRRGWQLAVKRL
jgi:hypothetical protein